MTDPKTYHPDCVSDGFTWEGEMKWPEDYLNVLKEGYVKKIKEN